MNTEPLQWSEEKQQGLQVHLTGMWALDTWELGGPNGKYRRIHFRGTAPLTGEKVRGDLKNRRPLARCQV